MKDRDYYEFVQTPRGQPQGPRTSSDELKLAGLGVLWKADCSAVLIYQGEEYLVYCF